jgi:hypothetical protein
MTTNVFNHLLNFSINKTIITRMEDYEKKEAAIRLMAELEKGRISGEKESWQTLEEVRKEFGLTNDTDNSQFQE